MTEHCACCDRAVPPDAPKAAYVRTVESVVVAVVEYRLCGKCARRAKRYPRRIARAMRATYERTEMN